MYKKLFTLAILAILICFSESSRAAEPELDAEAVRRIIESSQAVLARAAARGGEESIMIVGGEAGNHAPKLLSILPLFGITEDALRRFQLREGGETAIAWHNLLVRADVLERGRFAIDKLISGLSKADDIFTEGGINPKLLMTNVYNLVRFLYERDQANPYRAAAVRDLVFNYFDKLQEQDAQCCRGAIGRNFHVLILSCAYLLDQHNADVARRRAQERAAASSADMCGAAEDAAQAAAVAAAQQALQERLRQEMQAFIDEEILRRTAILAEYSTSSPRLLIHPGVAGRISPLYLSLADASDVRTANRLYNEEHRRREAEILAARQRAEAEAIMAAEAEKRAIADMEARLKEAETTMFAPASMIHVYRERAILDLLGKGTLYTTTPSELQLLTFNLFADANPAIRPYSDLLRRAYIIKNELGEHADQSVVITRLIGDFG